jgi:hypothetical protein
MIYRAPIRGSGMSVILATSLEQSASLGINDLISLLFTQTHRKLFPLLQRISICSYIKLNLGFNVILIGHGSKTIFHLDITYAS